MHQSPNVKDDLLLRMVLALEALVTQGARVEIKVEPVSAEPKPKRLPIRLPTIKFVKRSKRRKGK